ncbi:hypothetical protein P280DRAFT_553584 [Massarina eburnea CBS 473.64]|uniref:Uncharacterized protein n=1 Tax=Massarina eburnea CBS 473.64 TaxID=1395130 RepID=A0A6A6RJM0_9PLEO|nr:hypothetical protein P280DRAFT_553584 [Massarina eburnea CBS 473.64]
MENTVTHPQQDSPETNASTFPLLSLATLRSLNTDQRCALTSGPNIQLLLREDEICEICAKLFISTSRFANEHFRQFPTPPNRILALPVTLDSEAVRWVMTYLSCARFPIDFTVHPPPTAKLAGAAIQVVDVLGLALGTKWLVKRIEDSFAAMTRIDVGPFNEMLDVVKSGGRLFKVLAVVFADMLKDDKDQGQKHSLGAWIMQRLDFGLAVVNADALRRIIREDD